LSLYGQPALEQSLREPYRHFRVDSEKMALIRGLKTSVEVMQLAHGLFDGLMFDQGRMREAMADEMLATDRALQAVAAGDSFREAYRAQKGELQAESACEQEGKEMTIERSIRDRVSLGACGNMALDRLHHRLALWIQSA